jgi:hypothetical protein
MSKPLQIKPTMRTTPCVFAERINQHAAVYFKHEGAAMHSMLIAAAGLHLLKLESDQGDWLTVLASTTKIKPRTAQQWMANLDALFDRVGYVKEVRAYNAIFAERTDDQWSQNLLLRINEWIEGLTQHQLEFSLSTRKPKKPLLPAAPKPDEDPAVVAQREIGQAFEKFCEGLAMLQRHSADLTDEVRAQTGYHCARHLQHMIPQGWTFHIHDHTGKHEFSIERYFQNQLQLPAPGPMP